MTDEQRAIAKQITAAADAEDDFDTNSSDRAGIVLPLAVGLAAAVGFVTGVATTLAIIGGL